MDENPTFEEPAEDASQRRFVNTSPLVAYEPGLLAKLASFYMHEYGSDNLVKGGSGIDLVIR